jgi:hypothetical protein
MLKLAAGALAAVVLLGCELAWPLSGEQEVVLEPELSLRLDNQWLEAAFTVSYFIDDTEYVERVRLDWDSTETWKHDISGGEILDVMMSVLYLGETYYCTYQPVELVDGWNYITLYWDWDSAYGDYSTWMNINLQPFEDGSRG